MRTTAMLRGGIMLVCGACAYTQAAVTPASPLLPSRALPLRPPSAPFGEREAATTQLPVGMLGKITMAGACLHVPSRATRPEESLAGMPAQRPGSA